PRDPAGQGQDGADAGAGLRDRRADDIGRARGLHLRPDRPRPAAQRGRLAVAGRRRARQDEGRAARWRKAGREAEGARKVIVRLMGEGQFEIDDEVAKGLNDLDEQAAQAVEQGDEERLGGLLRRMGEAVRANGTRVPDDDLAASEGIVPPDDLTLDEARRLFDDEGLIPDLPSYEPRVRPVR